MNRRALLIFLAALSAAQLSRAQAFSPLEKLYEIPAVSGYEQLLSGEIRNQLKEFSPKTDNLGDVARSGTNSRNSLQRQTTWEMCT